MAFVALLLAMGTGAYAAVGLPANSVGTKQLKNGAVTSQKVKAHSLLGANFKVGQLPRGATGMTGPQGPRGALGPQGPPGPQGPSEVFTKVGADGGGLAGGPAELVSLNLAAGDYMGFARVDVANTGSVPVGVVCYIEELAPPLTRPVTQDVGTASVQLAPGEGQALTLATPISLSSPFDVSLQCYLAGSTAAVTSYTDIQFSAVKVDSLTTQ
jgi:hypothetical protein